MDFGYNTTDPNAKYDPEKLDKLELRLPNLLPFPGIAAAMVAEESGGNPNAVSPKKAFGPAQVDRKSTRLNSSHIQKSRMPSSA